jgi:membrane protease YdiL (CAAX protease family)
VIVVAAYLATSLLTDLVAVSLAFRVRAASLRPGAMVSSETLAASGDGVTWLFVVRLAVTVVVTCAALGAIRPASWRAYIAWRPPPRPRPLGLWLLAQAGVTVLGALASATSGTPSNAEHSRQLTETASLLPLFIVTIVVVAPFAEELFYRGLASGTVACASPHWGTALVIVIASSLVWAVEHPGNAFDRIALTFSGVLNASARLRTGSLWTPYLMHVGHNAFATVWILSGH